MQRMVKVGSIIVASLVMSIGLTGCGSLLKRDAPLSEDDIILGQEGRTMFEAGLQYVKIIDRDVPGIANEHPDIVTSEQMRTVLASLYASETILLSEKQVPIFSPGELQFLSAAISTGLSQAESHEDITFVSIGQHKGTIAKERKTNTGRLFISGGRLNIIFGKLHEIYRDKDPITNQPIDRRLNPLLPGSRSNDAGLGILPILDTGQSFYLDPETGKERRDWLVIDIATVLAVSVERDTGGNGLVSPELLEDVALSKKETGNLRQDIGSMKEIIFDMSEEIDRLKKEIEDLKSKSQ